tara:strand:- start:287 stop:508 length:222 start_codon:yes stop_codon:yes gene_type:complete
MSQNDRLLKLAQRLAEKVGLTDETKNKEQAGLIMVSLIKDLNTISIVRELEKENSNDADLGKLVRVLISNNKK